MLTPEQVKDKISLIEQEIKKLNEILQLSIEKRAFLQGQLQTYMYLLADPEETPVKEPEKNVKGN